MSIKIEAAKRLNAIELPEEFSEKDANIYLPYVKTEIADFEKQLKAINGRPKSTFGESEKAYVTEALALAKKHLAMINHQLSKVKT